MKKNDHLAPTKKSRGSFIRFNMKWILLPFCMLFVSVSTFSTNKEENEVISSIKNTLNVNQDAKQTITITGKVTDEEGEELPGVSIVLLPEKRVGNRTDAEGKYVFTNLKAGDKLLLSFVGMDSREIVVKQGQTVYNVKMNSSNVLKEVVVQTGMFQRDKVSYTGSAASYSGEELKLLGNQNLIESLKILDPAFVLIESLENGSNPNSTATIELRGQGSATINAITDEFSTDPNQPLFILNGVETSYNKIKDMDMNRVASVDILKDAGSTAIYGSKGANGVIVIETVKPKVGELKLYYNGDFNIEMPDLSVYNLMNSDEKLKFELEAGKYSTPSTGTVTNANYQKALTDLYNSRLADVKRGVDTYWLSEPVRTAFTQSHSIRISGGDQAITYDIGGKYKIQEGVMKESGRDVWSGDVGLVYRKGKFIVSNTLDASGYTANESSYGSFKDWANTSPYFTKRNADGGIDKFLQQVTDGSFTESQSPITTNIGNPMYNATIGNVNETVFVELLNSLSVQYVASNSLRFKAGLDLATTRTDREIYTPPEHTKYYESDASKKGDYAGRFTKSNTYRGFADASYAMTTKTGHSVTVNVRGQLRQQQNEYTSFTAQGFAPGSKKPNMGVLTVDGKPGYSFSDRRTVSLIGSANYNYLKRYLVDFSYSLDGATTFGSNKLYKSFWSAGIGWNINREAFLADINWLEMLRVSATTGMSGNQNQGKTVSETVYKTLSNTNIFGQGLTISDFANPDLPWQTARDYGVGFEMRMLRGRYTAKVECYNSKTDPNIIFVAQVPSTGVTSYPMALGHLTKKGVEFVVAAYPVYNLKERIMVGVRVTGLNSKSTYGGLGNTLDVFNENQRKDNTLVQYRDGYSPTDIWAVRSYGIDPADGTEVYIKKNGELTKEYNADEIVRVGNTRPTMTGVITPSVRYKSFYVSMSLRYSFGGDIYNSALYNKVENITKEALQYNQDKRALYDRWKTAGDVAQFKSISIVSSSSAKTSRFIQKNDYLKAESISFSYEINDNEWLTNHLAVKTMKLTGYLNDIFRLETSRTERGIEYPFARSFSLSVNLSF